MIVVPASTSSVHVPTVGNKIKRVMKSLSNGKKQKFVIGLVINTANIGPYNGKKELFGMEIVFTSHLLLALNKRLISFMVYHHSGEIWRRGRR